MDFSTCSTDADCSPCTTGRWCYANITWLEPGEDQCQCNNFYGWVGPNCDEFSLGTKLSMAYYALLSLACAYGFLVSLHLFVKRWIHKKRTLNASMTTLILCIMAFLGMMLWTMFTAINFASVGVHQTPPTGFETKGCGRYEFWVPKVLQPWGGIMTTAAQMNIALMWVEVVEHANQMRVKTSTNLSSTRKYVLWFQGTLFVAICASLVVQQTLGLEIISFACIPFALVLVVLYLIASRRMSTMLNTTLKTSTGTGAISTSDRRKYAKMIIKVRLTAITIAATSMMFVVSGCLFSVLVFKQKEEMQPGDTFSWVKFFHHLIPFWLALGNFAVWFYVRGNLRRELQRKVAGESSFIAGGTAVNSNAASNFKTYYLPSSELAKNVPLVEDQDPAKQDWNLAEQDQTMSFGDMVVENLDETSNEKHKYEKEALKECARARDGIDKLI